MEIIVIVLLYTFFVPVLAMFVLGGNDTLWNEYKMAFGCTHFGTAILAGLYLMSCLFGAIISL